MFDIDRMKEILDGDFYRMPSGITREERREFMKDVAEGKVEPVSRRTTYGFTKEKAYKVSLNTEEAYVSKFKPLTKEQLKKTGEESLRAYEDVDRVFKLEEFIQL